MNRKERRKLAKQSGSASHLSKAAELTKQGMALAQAGKNAEAIALYKRSLAFDATNTDSFYVLGVLHRRVGQLDKSVQYYHQALAIQPAHVDAYFNLGNILTEQGALAEAVQAFTKAVTINPQFIKAYNNLGNVFKALENYEDAEKAFRKVLTSDPNNVDTLFNLGELQHTQGFNEAAVATFQNALAIDPNHVETLNNLGAVYRDLKQPDESAACLQKAIALSPEFALAHSNLGNTLNDLGHLDEAYAHFQRALAINPDNAKTYTNLGNLLQDMERLDEAAGAYEKALALEPDFTEAHANLGLYQLMRGDYAKGWENFGWRWLLDEFGSRALQSITPLWEGEPLKDKKLLLWDEQGVGETFVFATMFTDLLKMGADITLRCDPRLVPLLKRSFSAITCLAKVPGKRFSETLAEKDTGCDFHAPLGNLGRWLRPDAASFPKPSPYLIADDIQTQVLRKRYLREGGTLLVGIAWHSKSPNYGEQKSMTLMDLKPVLEIPGLTFVDLQYGDHEKERKDFTAQTGIEILHDANVDQMADIDMFAAQTAAMDLVVTISNTTAHMAGALGVPTLLMLRHVPIWYWMTEREDNPWYGSLRLFRQTRPNQWADVVERVAEGLRGHLQTDMSE